MRDHACNMHDLCAAASQVVYAITSKVATVLLASFPGSPHTRAWGAWEWGYCVITATRVTLLWLKRLICFCSKYKYIIVAHKPELLLQVWFCYCMWAVCDLGDWGFDSYTISEKSIPFLANLVISFLVSKTRCVCNCCQHLLMLLLQLCSIKYYAASHVCSEHLASRWK